MRRATFCYLIKFVGLTKVRRRLAHIDF